MLPDKVIQTYNRLVVQSNGCWRWNGATDGQYGYGHIRSGGVDYKAHRVSYEIYKGSIPTSMWVLHTCDNGACTNPDHLFLGTAKDNAVDRMNKGRNGNIRGELNGRAKLSQNQVDKIIQEYSLGNTTQQQLADTYGVTRGMISHIVNERNW